MNRLTLLLALILLPHLLGGASAHAQQEMVLTIPTSLGDTTETFWLQIPRGYQPGTRCPLLIGWHQWGGDHLEMRQATRFDSVANARKWIAASHRGVSPTHWNNHATQSHVVDMIRWIEARYSVDSTRIYMVGASMGGAAGMVFSNNHLDPAGPMVASAASLSGIQDCERRFHEQGINNSMIESFGGTPEQVPFTYHRNSAIFFADSTNSMHRNARHLPLLLTFGQGTSDQIWREHAEDLYAVLSPFADDVVLHESSHAGHGWGCAEEGLTCDFLEQFSLDARPLRISVQADEEGRWYWADLTMRNPVESFCRLEATADPALASLAVSMIRNVEEASLDLPSIGFPCAGSFTCAWAVLDGPLATLTFQGIAASPVLVLRDGQPFSGWTYDPVLRSLSFAGWGSALYRVMFDPASAPPGPMDPPACGPAISVRSVAGGGIELSASARGSLSWRMFDALGRLELQSTGRVPAPCVFRIEAPAGAAAGIHWIAAEVKGREPVREVAKVLLVR